MNFEDKFFEGIKEIKENESSGVTTCKINKNDLYFALLSWYGVDELGFSKAENIMSKVVRGYKKADNGFTFQHGVGYDWRTDDLLSDKNLTFSLYNYFLDAFYIPRLSNEDIKQERLNQYIKAENVRKQIINNNK